ncbi:hypothetical protein SAY87_028312 [Trapa incisa]|uniref:Protein kinase domain-containing protein n=1 Tax=Trapa incisa TaxID=236973 RepID=A0AAN7KP43_9MYRT|nr:hypothetical protein SAY87_028312 [Trapa incisa]
MEGSLQAVISAVGAFLVVSMIFTCILRIFHGRRRQRQCRPAGNTREIRQGALEVAELRSIIADESTSFDPSLRVSMAELLSATKQFSSDLIIGDGGFGLVYKAQLSSGVTVAIKKLSPDAFQGFREFRAEMETLGKLQHPNIVKILGYCVSNTDRILMYEFIEKGSLDVWLYEYDNADDGGGGHSSWPSLAFERFVPLSWATRLKIIRGVASGLAYLHDLHPKRIIHRDIKASNVLLDRNFEAHIADFGLARTIDASRTHISTQVAGTTGYMPPEFKAGLAFATVYSDVYSFGVLMFEVATGQRPNLPVKVQSGSGQDEWPTEMGLIEWVRRMVTMEKEMAMMDPIICREGLDEAMVKEYIRIATLCTDEMPRRRPPMAQVLDLLGHVLP